MTRRLRPKLLAIPVLALALVACRGPGPANGATTPASGSRAVGAKPDPGAAGSTAGPARPAAGSGSGAGSVAEGPPASANEAWHESDTPFRLVLTGNDELSLEADGLVHAGVEIYALRDEHALASLVRADGANEVALRVDTSRAIAASAVEGRPTLAQPPPPGPAHALELLEHRTVELADPTRPTAISLASLQGLRLVCVRAGRRVAAVPVARGPLALILARAGADLVGLAARGPTPDRDARGWLVTDGGLAAAEREADGLLRWRGAGSRAEAALAVARAGDDWAIARVGVEPDPPSAVALFPFGSGRPGSPAWAISTGGPGIVALATGPLDRTNERRTIAVDRLERWTPLEDDGPARVVAFERDRLDRPIAGDPRSAWRPATRPLAAITVDVALEPARPIEGEAIRLDLVVRDAAGTPVEAFEVERLDVARDAAPLAVGRAGRASLELPPRSAGSGQVTLDVRLSDGSALTVAPRIVVLPAAGLSVWALPAKSAVVAPRTPLAVGVRSRHAGDHVLRMVRPTGEVIERLTVDPARAPVAYFYPRARGAVHLELVAPTGEIARTGPLAIGAGPGLPSDGPPIEVGVASSGLPWPVVVRAPAGEAGLAVVDRVDPPAVVVVAGGAPCDISGLAPSRPFRLRPRVALCLARARWVADVEVGPEAGGTLPASTHHDGLIAFSDIPIDGAPAVAPAREVVRWTVVAHRDGRALYRVAHRLVDLWCFEASAALARRDHRTAADLAGRILGSYPDHPAARGILVQARRARENAGEATPRTPLERLRAVKLMPRWDGTPLVLALAQVRDAAGVEIALEVADPYRPVTLELEEPADGDALVRRVIGELGLAYRVRDGEVVVEDPAPRPPRGESPSGPPRTRWVATFRPLDPEPGNATLEGTLAPIPPGPWRVWVFPRQGGLPEWRDVTDPAGGRLAAVLPAFLRAGDRARVAVVATAGDGSAPRAPGASAHTALQMAAEPPPRGVALAVDDGMPFLELAAPSSGAVTGRVGRGARALDLAVPVVGEARTPPTARSVRLERDAPVAVQGPATLVVDPDRLARLLRALVAAPAPATALDSARRLVVLRLTAERVRRWSATRSANDVPGGESATALALAAAATVDDALPLATDPGPLSDRALALALATDSGKLPPAILEERVVALRLRAAFGAPGLDPAARAALFWALAAHSAARAGTSAVAWDELGPLDPARTDAVTLARLVRAAHAADDRVRATALVAHLERAAVRDATGDARFEASGVDAELATAEAACALLEHDVASPAGQAAAAALARSPSGTARATWAALEAMARSIPELPTAEPTRVMRLVVDGKAIALEGAPPGRSVGLELSPGPHTVALGAGKRPASAELHRDAAPADLDARWTDARVALGGTVGFAASVPAGEDRARVLIVPLPPGCRARVEWAGGARYDAASGELVLELGSEEVTVAIEVRALVPGRYALPGAVVRGAGGEALLAAPASSLEVVAPRR